MGRLGGAVFFDKTTDFLSTHWLDIVTTILGLIYLVLEYRASIALWVVGIVMPAMDIYLYWSHGLYGDAGMAVYYTLAAIYGYAVWHGIYYDQKKNKWKWQRPNLFCTNEDLFTQTIVVPYLIPMLERAGAVAGAHSHGSP